MNINDTDIKYRVMIFKPDNYKHTFSIYNNIYEHNRGDLEEGGKYNPEVRKKIYEFINAIAAQQPMTEYLMNSKIDPQKLYNSLNEKPDVVDTAVLGSHPEFGGKKYKKSMKKNKKSKKTMKKGGKKRK